jgi:hypothetical protein
MTSNQFRVPAVVEYATAFRAIADRITPKQLEMLRFHHSAPAHVVSATLLANHAGFDGYPGANLQYGLLAGELLNAMSLRLPSNYVNVGILVDFVGPKYAANQEYLWVMRPQVVEALEALGWVPTASHLLYPAEAVPAPV